MEIVCTYRGKAWRLRIWTHDLLSTAWLRDHDSSLPFRTTPEGTLFEGKRDNATENDPMVELHMSCRDGVAEVRADCAGRTVLLTNRTALLPSGHMQVPSVEETFVLALRWLTGFDSIGPVDIDDEAFFADSITATVLRVRDVERWVTDGTPIPSADGSDALAYIAFAGPPGKIHERMLDSIERGKTNALVRLGSFYGWERTAIDMEAPFPEVGCLLAVGTATMDTKKTRGDVA